MIHFYQEISALGDYAVTGFIVVPVLLKSSEAPLF